VPARDIDSWMGRGARGLLEGMQPDADDVCVDCEKLEAALYRPSAPVSLHDESSGALAAILKPCGKRAKVSARETPRESGLLGVERTQERAARVRSELELRGAGAQRFAEKRSPEAVDGVADDRRCRCRSCRLSLEPFEEVLENRVRRDVELHFEARRGREILLKHEIARITYGDLEPVAGQSERERAEAAPLFRGKTVDDVGIGARERRPRDSGQTVGLRESGREHIFGDGSRREECPLDRPAVRLLPRRGSAEPMYRQIAGFRQDISDTKRYDHRRAL
jgi:hypothetical protein